MVQEYLPGAAKEGDVRILLLNSEVLGAMRRKPRHGDFRANIHAGATPLAHEVTQAERKICDRIADRLIEDGLYFVGIDVIDDRLVEINCLSPGGLTRINRLHNLRLQEKVVDFIECRIHGRV